MTREQAIKWLQDYLRNTPFQMEQYEKAFEMAIKALEQNESAEEWYKLFVEKLDEQEPCDVSVSEKEPNEITEEVTLRFFKNSLKVRWHDFVIYNVEWLKKNWQMEMDIVCGVKPCDDAISREWVKTAIHNFYYGLKHTPSEEDIQAYIDVAPSVTHKSGKWIKKEDDICWWYECSECNHKPLNMSYFCPNCGTKMESGDKE